jgi:hypothetical protein
VYIIQFRLPRCGGRLTSRCKYQNTCAYRQCYVVYVESYSTFFFGQHALHFEHVYRCYRGFHYENPCVGDVQYIHLLPSRGIDVHARTAPMRFCVPTLGCSYLDAHATYRTHPFTTNNADAIGHHDTDFLNNDRTIHDFIDYCEYCDDNRIDASNFAHGATCFDILTVSCLDNSYISATCNFSRRSSHADLGS